MTMGYNFSFLWLVVVLLGSTTRIPWTLAEDATCVRSTVELTSLESQVTDVSVVRVYSFCDDSLLQIGSLDFFDNLVAGGMDWIRLRPNLHLQCGTTGARSNNCIINMGDVQMEGTRALGSNGEGDAEAVLSNVVITGFIFRAAKRSMIWIDKPGDILFQDCEFRENAGVSPILLDYSDSASPSTELNVRFEQCDFVDNGYPGPPAQTTLIVGNSLQNRVSLTDCRFTRNNMVFNNTNSARSSSLIETNGPVSLTRTCFQDITVGVAPVVVYSSILTASLNSANYTSSPLCGLGAVFSTAESLANFIPICVAFDATTCAIGSSSNVSTPTTSSPMQAGNSTMPNSTSAPPITTTFAPTIPPTLSPTTVPPTQTPTRRTFSPQPSVTLAPNSSLPTIVSVSPSEAPILVLAGNSSSLQPSSQVIANTSAPTTAKTPARPQSNAPVGESSPTLSPTSLLSAESNASPSVSLFLSITLLSVASLGQLIM